MHVGHPNILFSPNLELKKACLLYMPAWYTHRFTVENFVRKGKNVGYKQMFSQAFVLKVIKTWDYVVKS